MSSSYRILHDGDLIPATTLEWVRWFETSDERIVAHSWAADAEILTICLGMMPPGSLFKTFVTGGIFDGATESYLTLEDAMWGHERWFGRAENAGDYP